jgi:hypothetical protein
VRTNKAALKARGVTHAASFGFARRDNHPDSDIDILVELAPARCSDGRVGALGPQKLYRQFVRRTRRRGEPRNLEAVPPPRRAALHDFLHHIDLATRFVAGVDCERFQEAARTVYAVTRRLEIISEASRRLPAALKSRHQ